MRTTLPSNKTFGYFFSFIFLILTIYFYFTSKASLTLTFLLLFIIFLTLSIFFSHKLKILNFIWIKFGLFLGGIIAPVILFLLFFFIFTPVGFLLKIFRVDILKLKNKKEFSYWVKRRDKIRSMEELF